jgi:hypothetical protein
MHPLRRVNAFGALAVVIVTLALVAPIARQPTLDRFERSRPVPRASIHDTATEIIESAAVDTASVRSWQRSREPVLGLGTAAALSASVAAATLCFLKRSARDRLCSHTVTANGMRAPPDLHALS